MRSLVMIPALVAASFTGCVTGPKSGASDAAAAPRSSEPDGLFGLQLGKPIPASVPKRAFEDEPWDFVIESVPAPNEAFAEYFAETSFQWNVHTIIGTKDHGTLPEFRALEQLLVGKYGPPSERVERSDYHVREWLYPVKYPQAKGSPGITPKRALRLSLEDPYQRLRLEWSDSSIFYFEQDAATNSGNGL